MPKHSKLLGQFLSYIQNEVLWIRTHMTENDLKMIIVLSFVIVLQSFLI
jgi:hypothetical protein